MVAQAVRLAAAAGWKCVIVTDSAHLICRPGAETVVVMQGADSVDYEIVRRLFPGDGVVTQDYGLAALCLSRGTRVLNQDGREYRPENIDGLLFSRYANAKARRAGERTRGPKKRRAEQDAAFEASLRKLLREEEM